MLLCLLVLSVIQLQVADVVLKSELVKCEQKVVPVDCLAVAAFTAVTRLTRNERDVLTHTLLNCLASLLRNLRVFRECFLHYSADVRYREVSILFLVCACRVFHD